ncbi:hypothetical protein [Clostridium formicaceticum]|uniref:Uncharacterized protein n=1 Tax=Clostridium formicaceticum TaxID=1497 RepID=A0AAC9WF90_9CLOT|nr:hypothetical protein [Clostridium formicaceticum]AOY75440.1 hypothetical protein BJL90_05745 [Clostridium formicaceticum]ARE85725.1 hypothetical protein CLFO_00380 [Clostridium formicaceticum]
MSYVVVGDKIIDSEEILKDIVREFEFKEVKDLSKGSKREDTLIYKIVQEEDDLKEQLVLQEMEENLTTEEFIEELMALADENIVFIEDVIPEGFICYGYSYHYDEGLKEVKSIFVAIDENVGEKKLKEVVNRVLTSVD